MCAVPQLRDALAKNAVRVGDLFREWDDDNNGKVSKEEFTRGLKELGFEASDATTFESRCRPTSFHFQRQFYNFASK